MYVLCVTYADEANYDSWVRGVANAPSHSPIPRIALVSRTPSPAPPPQGPVRALAVNSGGHYLVTAGLDCQVKVWDVRTYQEVHAYFSSAPADSIDLSQR